jgi:hypothetical protein
MTSKLDNLADCPLSRATPFGVRNVSQTQFSVARYTGAIIYNGQRYTYFADCDELVRDDVLKWMNKNQKAK